MSFEPFAKRVWLSTPTMHEGTLTYVEQAYRTNWMSTVGENVDAVESLCSSKIGMEYGVALSCGTAALHLAIKLAGIGRGDRVFCSDLTFAATTNPIVYEGGIPVFIDCERTTWNMDPEALERAFSLYPDTKAVMLVHLYGIPARIDEIKEITARHGAVLIEDAAESFGATYKGRQTGSAGDLSAISFNGNKIITGTCGGMLFAHDKAKADLARKWSTQSREPAPWYQHEQLGYNYRMSNVVAGIVRAQLPHLEEHIAQKKAIYYRYKEGLRDLPVSMNPFDEANSEPNFWLSSMLIDREAMCEQTRTDLAATYRSAAGKSCPTEILETLARYNAEGRPIWKPMHSQPIYREYPFVSAGEGDDVGTDLFTRGLCLPSDNKMTEAEQNTVIAIIKSCFE